MLAHCPPGAMRLLTTGSWQPRAPLTSDRMDVVFSSDGHVRYGWNDAVVLANFNLGSCEPDRGRRPPP